MTENRVYLNSDNFKNSFNEDEVEKLVFRSTVKYEIKQLLNRQIKLKIKCSLALKDKKVIEKQLQNEYLLLLDDADMDRTTLKMECSESLVIKNIREEYFYIKKNMRTAHYELSKIKQLIKSKNRLLNK